MADLPQDVKDAAIKDKLELMTNLETEKVKKLNEISMEINEKIQKKKREYEVLSRQLEDKQEKIHQLMKAQQAVQRKVRQAWEEKMEAERIHLENVAAMNKYLMETLENQATEADN